MGEHACSILEFLLWFFFIFYFFVSWVAFNGRGAHLGCFGNFSLYVYMAQHRTLIQVTLVQGLSLLIIQVCYSKALTIMSHDIYQKHRLFFSQDFSRVFGSMLPYPLLLSDSI